VKTIKPPPCIARRETERPDARARFLPVWRACRRRSAPPCWRNGGSCGTAATPSARRRGFRLRPRQSSKLRAVRRRRPAGSRAAAPPASTCRRRDSRSSACNLLNGKSDGLCPIRVPWGVIGPFLERVGWRGFKVSAFKPLPLPSMQRQCTSGPNGQRHPLAG
jgi:hypothetical protein